ncbi:hypothetical protein D791_00978 [Nitrincola nitratireducens]|uniref:Uncharacterized protein n=1 Tax=Nitrincola nitratireducens TaxID=1229521 RepID=W9UXW5_9GAMM|nr:DUF1302 family protein [Nitrincola nitratireducens]EXJ12093.1 hypothetical protein D791_00978 [Nitrincola nitratireducens]
MATIYQRKARTLSKSSPFFAPSILAGIVAASISAQSHGLDFQLGEIQGRFDSNLSIGTSVRLKDADQSLISPPNGGTSRGSGSYDDGTQNFKKGKPFSTVVKGVHDLDLRYNNLGFLLAANIGTIMN